MCREKWLRAQYVGGGPSTSLLRSYARDDKWSYARDDTRREPYVAVSH
jgi:hypothetical protein